MQRPLAALCAIVTIATMTACGGGGGSSDAGPVLTFAPSTLTASTLAGTSATLSVRATATDPSAFTGTVYVYVVDSQQVLSGTVSLTPVNTSTYSATLTTSTALAAGRHQGAFQIQVCHDAQCAQPFPGSPVALPYDITVQPLHGAGTDSHRLLVSQWGVGLAASPTGTTLTRAITVSDNYGGALPWTAASDSAWLTATTSGTTGNGSVVTLNADPASLPLEQVSYARVTLSSTTAGVAPAVVRVALWKSATGLSTQQTVAVNARHIVTDRIRPFVYANNGGSAIDIYQAYTGQKVGSIAAVGTALGEMTPSADGSRLYVLDTAAKSVALIDLDAPSKVASWTLDKAIFDTTPVQAIRPNGVDVLLVGDGTAYANGKSLGTTGISNKIAATSDGRRVYTQDVGFSPASVGAYDVDYTDFGGGSLVAKKLAGASFVGQSSNGRDIAVSLDGQHLYTASGAPYKCSAVDPAALSFIGYLAGGAPYPNNIEVTSDGRAVCGNGSSFWVHSADGALLKTVAVSGGFADGQLVVTPDGFVVVTAGSSAMTLVPIGP